MLTVTFRQSKLHRRICRELRPQIWRGMGSQVRYKQDMVEA
jgi:hypothetical protein